MSGSGMSESGSPAAQPEKTLAWDAYLGVLSAVIFKRAVSRPNSANGGFSAQTNDSRDYDS